jgi:hypothetical protein
VLAAAAITLPARYTHRASIRSVSAVHSETVATYPAKNIPPTIPAWELESDHSSRSSGRSAAYVEKPSIDRMWATRRTNGEFGVRVVIILMQHPACYPCSNV